MSYTEVDQEDVVPLSSFPAKTMMWLAFLMSVGSALFLMTFHSVTWVFGWPGPFLWFGSPSRLADILSAAFGTALFVFMFSALSIPVIKGLAATFGIFDVKIRVR